jgi:uncharacterized protein
VTALASRIAPPAAPGASPAAVLVALALCACATAPRPRPDTGIAGPTARPPVPEAPFAPPAPGRPRVAIVIDDLGDSGDQVRPFLDVALPLSFAVLPTAADAPGVARGLSQLGRDVLAHVPMEPDEAEAMARGGFLTVSMSAEAIAAGTRAALDRVPGAVGANNHMGSRFTRSANALAPFLEVLKARGLFFLDSRTTPDTVAEEAAAARGVPALRRAVFLDNDPSPAAVEAQLAGLQAVAKVRGCAVAIGHGLPATAAALARFAADPAREVDVVPVSRLLGEACARGAGGN